MRSRLYECQVMHARLLPRAHRFAYRIFMVGLDLDELELLQRRLRLFSVNRGNLFSFRERDHLPLAEPLHNPSGKPVCHLIGDKPASLKARVLARLAAEGIDPGHGARVELVTLPRMFGYLFNPVSFYFVHDAAGAPVAAIAEVTNTFREMKSYVLGPDTLHPARAAMETPASDVRNTNIEEDPAGRRPVFRLRTPKFFYVSPFSDVDVAFDFKLRTPDERLAVQIDDYIGEDRTLTSTLAGPARPLTDGALASYVFKYPLLTLRVITLIHWHALRLFLKKVPWFAKAARPADQRDLHHPHKSISGHHGAPDRGHAAEPGPRLATDPTPRATS
ncbi:MAG: DUF1365 domain-containing protein [Verrucomicrobiota bacterium]